ncbi:hypothetical protein GN956_G18572 [Arapaima gigas]
MCMPGLHWGGVYTAAHCPPSGDQRSNAKQEVSVETQHRGSRLQRADGLGGCGDNRPLLGQHRGATVSRWDAGGGHIRITCRRKHIWCSAGTLTSDPWLWNEGQACGSIAGACSGPMSPPLSLVEVLPPTVPWWFGRSRTRDWHSGVALKLLAGISSGLIFLLMPELSAQLPAGEQSSTMCHWMEPTLVLLPHPGPGP